MKNLINYLSKKSLSLGNGPALDRRWTGSLSVALASPAGFPFRSQKSIGFSTRSFLSILTLFLMLFSFGVGNAWGVSYTATYTVASTSSVTKSGTAPTGSTAAFEQDYTTAGQMTSAKPNSLLTLSGYDGKRITGVTLNVKRTNSKTANVTVKVGSSTIGSNASLAPGNNYGDKTVSVTSTVVGTGETVTIKMVASGSSVFIASYKITWEDATPHDVSFNTGAGNPSVATRRGVTVTLPDEDDLTPACSGDGWTLYGWATAAYGSSSTTTAPSATFVGCGGDTYEPADDVTLYAVYAKVATDVAASAQTLSFAYSTTSWSKYHFTDKSTYWLIHGDDGYIESPMMMDLSTITSIVVQAGYFGGSAYGNFQLSGNGTNYGSEQTCSNSTESTSKTVSPGTNPLSGKGRIKLQCTGTASDANGVRIKTITINYTAPPTYYWSAPTCCTALGTINGSINWNNPTEAEVTWDIVDHVDSWTLKYKVHGAGAWTTAFSSKTASDSEITEYDSDDDDTDDRNKATITGLTCNTAYDFQIIANPASGYCDKDETLDNSGSGYNSGKYAITLTGGGDITGGVFTSDPEEECASEIITLEAAPNTGYEFTNWEITYTDSGDDAWEDVNGDDDDLVSDGIYIEMPAADITVNAVFSCVEPVIGTQPSDASYIKDASPSALSVSATLSSGTRTYLWKVSTNGGSTWSDAGGTNNAATYSGSSLSTASTGTLKFKCIVGNSEGGCTVESNVATITINAGSTWKFKYSGDSYTEHTMTESDGVASYSISLAADTRFEFCIDDNGTAYKNNGTIITTTSGWVFNTSDNNCKIHTGPAGTYTFAINTTSKAVTVTYPTVDHPNDHYVYFKNTNVWGTVYGYLANSGNDNKAAAWPGSVMQPTTTICGETYHYAALNAMSGTYNTIIFNNGNNGYGNQTSDLSTTGSLGKYNANQDANWHQFKYSISFAGNGNTDGSMSSITELCPGSNQALTSNAFTKTHYTFAGWHADVAVKVGESTIDAGDMIEDAVTIKDIQSDIALTAQWSPVSYTITKTLTNVSNTGLPASFTYTGAATTALNSTFTVDATNFFLPSSITVTMGGSPLTAGSDYTYNSSTGAFTFSAVITGNIVITATATAKLKSIAITTQPTTRKYFAGESFSSTGAVVTATMGDGSTKAVTASTTWTPPATPLAAGTGLTVTASYTENAINMTATTTIDVYSVTVNKVNEDGDAVSADGVSAGWTVGTKALAASASGASKYVFKQWEVTGATAASTSSASTTLSNPTANVVVNAVFWKPRTVKWSVNGNDSYATGGPTTTVAYNGTISTVPTNPSGLACAGTFIAWTDVAHNNGQTAKPSASYYGAALYSAAGDFPNITDATTTFYAVFAEGGGAPVNTVMWSEDWTGATSSSGSGTPSPSDARPSAQGDHSGKTVYGGATITYTDGTGTYVRTNENNAGGTAPELLIKANENWTISGIPTGGAATLTLEYRTNGTLTVSTSTDNVSIGTKSGSNPYTNTITVGSGVTSFNLSFTQTSNRRIDNVSLKVASVSLTNYVTECDANIVKVTYNANSGTTSCTNTTTDKTEDFTVCSSAPTRDYYTFAGWLCSADSKTYAASATIPAAAIDADFTLTAQWTPVPYSIKYELYGGTNSGSNPATYNVTTATITLQDPTKGHDRFEGWYSTYSAGVYSDQVTSIPLGSHGDITLHAKWAERHEIIFDADGVTTTIYRADDENMEDAVAGQGSVPSDPDAPTACSSKVFVGWSESTIDGETDDEPGDLMKPATGTVDADKHYYAVWAIESSESGTVTVFNDAFQSVSNGSDYQDNKAKPDKYTTNKVYGTGSAGEARMSSSSASGSISIDLSGEDLESTITVSFKLKYWSDSESGSVSLSCMDDGNTASFSNSPFAYPTTSGWKDFSSTVTNVDDKVESITFNSTSGKRVYIKDIVITQTGTIYSYSAYSTSCCATKVNLTHNSPSNGSVAFSKTKVSTCDSDKEVTLTIAPDAGYKLTGWAVNTTSGYADAKATSPAVATNSDAVQNITLTFAEDANKDYDVTATFGAIPVSSLSLRAQQTGQDDKVGNDLTMNCYPKEGQTGGNDPLNHTLKVLFNEVLPANALDNTYTWSVRVKTKEGDWEAIGFTGNALNTNDIINSFNKNTGTLQIKATEGTAEIKITANDASGVSAKVTITVANVALSTLNVAKSETLLYVGESEEIAVTYDPINTTTKGYTTGSYTYVTIGRANDKITLTGKAATSEVTERVTLTSSDAGAKTATIDVTVKPLPIVTFEDIVHNKTDFVVPLGDGSCYTAGTGELKSTVTDGVVSHSKHTPSRAADVVVSGGNTCEQQHLHLIGWIRSDYSKVATYLNGGAKPSITDITSAGMDGDSKDYYFAAGESINVETYNGFTFYAVWAKMD